MNAASDLTAEITALRDDYTYRVNLLLDEGRDDLAAVLADRYLDAAARLVSSVRLAA